jgi:hypothetical protein
MDKEVRQLKAEVGENDIAQYHKKNWDLGDQTLGNDEELLDNPYVLMDLLCTVLVFVWIHF